MDLQNLCQVAIPSTGRTLKIFEIELEAKEKQAFKNQAPCTEQLIGSVSIELTVSNFTFLTVFLCYIELLFPKVLASLILGKSLFQLLPEYKDYVSTRVLHKIASWLLFSSKFNALFTIL